VWRKLGHCLLALDKPGQNATEQVRRQDGRWQHVGGSQTTPASVDGITAETLNRHYADISTHPQYT